MVYAGLKKSKITGNSLLTKPILQKNDASNCFKNSLRKDFPSKSGIAYVSSVDTKMGKIYEELMLAVPGSCMINIKIEN